MCRDFTEPRPISTSNRFRWRVGAALLAAALANLLGRVVEVDKHHDAGLGGYTGERDKADRHRNRHVETEPPHQPHSPDERERQRQHDDERLRDAPERRKADLRADRQ